MEKSPEDITSSEWKERFLTLSDEQRKKEINRALEILKKGNIQLLSYYFEPTDITPVKINSLVKSYSVPKGGKKLKYKTRKNKSSRK
jgi:hypothetical protein